MLCFDAGHHPRRPDEHHPGLPSRSYQVNQKIKTDLYKLTVYGTYLIFIYPGTWYYVAVQVKARFSGLTSILPGRVVWRARRCLSNEQLMISYVGFMR